jgi:MFS family permease
LIHLSTDFGVPYDRISNVPTLTQAGYAGGLLLISPLGDLVKRRPLILLIVMLGALLTIGLAVTKSLIAFEALCFIIGFVTVTPQILIPLTADIAPPEKRAQCTSIVLSGYATFITYLTTGFYSDFSWDEFSLARSQILSPGETYIGWQLVSNFSYGFYYTSHCPISLRSRKI